MTRISVAERARLSVLIGSRALQNFTGRFTTRELAPNPLARFTGIASKNDSRRRTAGACANHSGAKAGHRRRIQWIHPGHTTHPIRSKQPLCHSFI